MNKTKRKIVESSMKLFAEKGYDGTSIEEITSEVGVAKGTLYYHFSSKEEIFNFLVEEGMNLLKNSIKIKTDKQEKNIDKLRAIVIIQLKIIDKYENFMSIVLSEVWGNSTRSNTCKKYIEEYLEIVEQIILKRIKEKEIKEYNVRLLAIQFLGLACTSLYYKKQKDFNIETIYKQIDKNFIKPLKLRQSDEV